MPREMRLQASDLRNKIGFYKREAASGTDTGNPEGEFSTTPEFTARANVAARLGGETVLAGRLVGTNLVNITVRQSAASRLVTTAWRAKDERSGVIYNIRSIIDPAEGGAGHGCWIEMLCEKGVAA